MMPLLIFFGFFALLSVVALVKFQGNPIFLFTLLLCVTSLAVMWQAEREDRGAPATRRRAAKTRK